MKRLSLILMAISLSLLFSPIAQAEKLSPSALAAAVTNSANSTPLVIKLAREGDTKGLSLLSQHETNGDFLKVQDKYNNNLFHVAKNADTVQTITAMIQQFYGTKAFTQIESMIDQRNSFKETPLMAQINAGHADTFHPLYMHSTLKKKNDIARNQLARQRGMGPIIEAQNKAFYCQEIRHLASSTNGFSLLDASRAQAAYHRDMIPLARTISHLMPCLAQN